MKKGDGEKRQHIVFKEKKLIEKAKAFKRGNPGSTLEDYFIHIYGYDEEIKNYIDLKFDELRAFIKGTGYENRRLINILGHLEFILKTARLHEDLIDDVEGLAEKAHRDAAKLRKRKAPYDPLLDTSREVSLSKPEVGQKTEGGE